MICYHIALFRWKLACCTIENVKHDAPDIIMIMLSCGHLLMLVSRRSWLNPLTLIGTGAGFVVVVVVVEVIISLFPSCLLKY